MGISADGAHLRCIDRVKAGQTVLCRLPEDAVRIEGADFPLDVVYEDDYLLIVNKPPYLAVHPSAGKPEPTLANIVVGYYQRQGTPLAFRPEGRLDRNTSGLLLAAKNAHVAYALTHRVDKVYLAVALGRLTGSGVIDQPIRVKEGCTVTREVVNSRDIASEEAGGGGKPSVTRWEALGGNDTATLLRVVIETGRTHQIRAHMAWLGHPLAGDTMYGGEDNNPVGTTALIGRHALHCAEMRFLHPITGESMNLNCAPPEDFSALARKIIDN